MGQWMLVPLGMARLNVCARPMLDDWRIYHPNKDPENQQFYNESSLQKKPDKW